MQSTKSARKPSQTKADHLRLYFFMGGHYEEKEEDKIKELAKWIHRLERSQKFVTVEKPSPYILIEDQKYWLTPTGFVPSFVKLSLQQEYGDDYSRVIEKALQNIHMAPRTVQAEFAPPTGRLGHMKEHEWIALLTRDDSKDREVIGYATGHLVETLPKDEIEWLHLGRHQNDQYVDFVNIRLDYQGKGLCSVLMSYVFQQLQAHLYKRIILNNRAGQVGYSCYTKSAQPYYPQMKCLDRKKHPVCEVMSFANPSKMTH